MDTSETRATQVQHKCDISDTSATQVLHEQTKATRVKNFDFDNDTSEKMFSHPYISYMKNDYKERNNFIRRTSFWKYLFPMPK